jgi:hypothetical protein
MRVVIKVIIMMLLVGVEVPNYLGIEIVCEQHIISKKSTGTPRRAASLKCLL